MVKNAKYEQLHFVMVRNAKYEQLHLRGNLKGGGGEHVIDVSNFGDPI